ncbi:MAG: thioredoxin-dependent thiol peroxidase [Bacteroidales bacterium]|nr:thioredoxin-dependent thiol peroxidase [Bacteroidales bacterium]
MTYLTKGNKAPDFKAKNQDGKEISLSNYSGKKVILYFYPKDDTPGCTSEACNLRDNYKNLISHGFEVIGVSPDNEKSHTKFAGKYNLQFNLVADTTKSIMKEYGAWGIKKMYGREYEGVLRTTYVIDEEGKIELVVKKVDTKNHSQQILGLLGIK